MRHLILAAAALALALPAAAETVGRSPATLDVSQPWSRPAAAGMNGAGFLVLTNSGKTAETLVRAETAAARKVEIHQTSTAGGVMSMRRLDAGVAVPPGQSVVFAPGGRHLMLLGLTKPLAVGDHVPVTLVFASGKRLIFGLQVGTGAPMPQGHHH